MDPSAQNNSSDVALDCFRTSPDGAIEYAAQQPGDLRLFCEALCSSPHVTAAITSLRLSAENDCAATSGSLEFAEDLRKEYGIEASGDNIADDGPDSEDSDPTVVLPAVDEEDADDMDTSEGNKENVVSRSPSPGDAITPVSPPAATANRSSSPSPPPKERQLLDPWHTAIEDFGAMKVAGLVETGEEVPTALYLDLLLSVLKQCETVTVVSMPTDWRAYIGEKVKVAFPKLKDLSWT